MIDQHHQRGQERIENGSLGEVLEVSEAGEVLMEFDVTGQRAHPRRGGSRAWSGSAMRSTSTARRARPSPARRRDRWLADQQGAGLRRGIAGAQGHRLVRRPRGARHEGQDPDRIKRSPTNMRRSNAQTPSLAHRELPTRTTGPGSTSAHAPVAAASPGSRAPSTGSPAPDRHRSVKRHMKVVR